MLPESPIRQQRPEDSTLDFRTRLPPLMHSNFTVFILEQCRTNFDPILSRLRSGEDARGLPSYRLN